MLIVMHHAYSMRFECCEHKSDHSLVTFKRPNCLLRLRRLKPTTYPSKTLFFDGKGAGELTNPFVHTWRISIRHSTARKMKKIAKTSKRAEESG